MGWSTAHGNPRMSHLIWDSTTKSFACKQGSVLMMGDTGYVALVQTQTTQCEMQNAEMQNAEQ